MRPTPHRPYRRLLTQLPNKSLASPRAPYPQGLGLKALEGEQSCEPCKSQSPCCPTAPYAWNAPIKAAVYKHLSPISRPSAVPWPPNSTTEPTPSAPTANLPSPKSFIGKTILSESIIRLARSYPLENSHPTPAYGASHTQWAYPPMSGRIAAHELSSVNSAASPPPSIAWAT